MSQPAQVARVAVARCATYAADLHNVVTELLAGLGGLSAFVRPGQSVLIKPNLLTDRTPDEAVTTHPALVRTVVRMVKELGARPSVGDSPASAVKLERVWERTGMLDMCREEDVPLLNLEQAGSVPFSANGYSFSLAKPVLDADVVINMPKVKTHVLTILTAAVKNLYGTIPGFQKAQLHKRHPGAVDFGGLLAEIYRRIPPALSIADGIVGMEGDGPSAGRPVALGVLAAGSDALAVDLILCRLLTIAPRSVPYLRALLPSVHGRLQFPPIDVVGVEPDGVVLPRFRAPSTLRSHLIPTMLVKALAPWLWIRPSVSEACTGCRRCVETCPVDALTIAETGRAALEPRACLGCCCCHEICPARAITLVQSPLLKLIRGGKTL